MCDKEQLVSYLYDDLGDAERAAFAAHLRGCAECRDELTALRGVRADLISWSPPQPDFGFRVVREPKVVPMQAKSWRAWWTPAAGLAAAAALVLAAASAIAHVEIHRGADGITVRTGWSTRAAADESGRLGETRAEARVQPVASASLDPALLAALDRRLSALEAASREKSPGARNAAMLSARASDAELMRRMRELLAQSETKQQSELALRIAQVLRDVDAQRMADLSQIQVGLRGIRATMTEEAKDHRDWANYILTSSKQK